MARIHILETIGFRTYRAVVHDTAPAGNNPAGVSWAEAIRNAGLAATVLNEGIGSGQITAAEKADVLNAVLVEGSFTFTDDPNYTNAQRNAALDQVATQCITELKAELQRKLRFFGATRA